MAITSITNTQTNTNNTRPIGLLNVFIEIMQRGTPPAFFLNKQPDIYKFAQALFQDIEDKRSSVTALTRSQAAELGKNNLQFSNVKHESRINALYRLIGLPTELDLDNKFSIIDENEKKITNKQDLSKHLVQREFEQLQLTFKQFLSANNTDELNKQLDSLQATDKKLIAGLFDRNEINVNRLFPAVQFSQIQNVVEPNNRIAPSFASTEERYVNKTLTQPPFLESIITIRLLQQSGGGQINTQGAVEDVILLSLGYALGELAKQYQRNQAEAEKHLTDGIAMIRDKVLGVDSAAVKAANINANSRENDNITTGLDIRSQHIKTQAQLYEAIISLLPTENDVIPIGIDIGGVPFQSRNIKENALTHSFLSIVNSNSDALQRIIKENKKVMQKRQLTQDKLTAELGSIIGQISGISLAEIIIVISALFVLDENNLIGLLSKSRFNQLIAASDNNTSTSGSTDANGNQNTAQKEINIFNILKQFEKTRTSTTSAIQILQETIKSIYVAFKNQLETAHIVKGG